ncbi:flavin reductase [Oceanicoccus sp. KOV_DT_Chl]|uniref:flavin reductase n=1 Tax=Oceanicoccus sp. KOV_DT_Chl TaxID=1904639 RepID=UPI000C7DCCE8|nr:flavin reductase [Oceanicoccus sp. KOV_DT_Chl]
MKKEIKIKPFWYSDIWVFPKLITIITTLDKNGRVNAAPYSHIMQYDVMQKNPRMMIGLRQGSHTLTNIQESGEFVINCPPFGYLEDMMETARFYPAGVNELDNTRFTQIPSKKVKPPSLLECPQIMECTVDEIKLLEKSSGIVIANIEAIVMDEELEEMDREQRLKAMDLPVGLGDHQRKFYYHSRTTEFSMHELKETADAVQAADVPINMEWDDGAMQALMGIPAPVRKLVIKEAEDFTKDKGDDVVSLARFLEMGEEFGIDDELLDRFRV